MVRHNLGGFLVKVAFVLFAIGASVSLKAEPSGPMPSDWSIAEAIEDAPAKLEQCP